MQYMNPACALLTDVVGGVTGRGQVQLSTHFLGKAKVRQLQGGSGCFVSVEQVLRLTKEKRKLSNYKSTRLPPEDRITSKDCPVVYRLNYIPTYVHNVNLLLPGFTPTCLTFHSLTNETRTDIP